MGKITQWKPIKGYEGLYEVSNEGDIRSLKKGVHILSNTGNGNGYRLVFLYDANHIRKNHYVHRLVAEHFLEPIPGRDIVNHKDYNRNNNSADNLEWCTQLENVHYSKERYYTPKNVVSNTGYKYIQIKRGRYRVALKGIVYKTFSNLDEAIAFRNEISRGTKYEDYLQYAEDDGINHH